MINDISLDSLKIFYMVAQEKSFTRIAKKRYVSQSAITQTIKKIENCVGFSLFNRNKKGVELTSYGMEMFNRLTPVFSSLESLDVYLESINNLKSGEIKISCGTNLAKKILLDYIVGFNKCYPDIKISQYDYQFEKAVDMLQSAKIDMFLSQKDEKLIKNFNFLPIFTEKYVFVCSKKYFKYCKDDAFRSNFIVQNVGSKSREMFDSYMLKNNKDYKNSIEVAGYNMMVELCKNNIGIMMVPLYLVEQELCAGEFVNLNYKDLPIIEYGIYTNKFVNSGIVNKFLYKIQI